jgi:hypothetical protein
MTQFGTVKDVRPPSLIAYLIKFLHLIVNVIHLFLNTFIRSFLVNNRQTGTLKELPDGPERKFVYNGPRRLQVKNEVCFEEQGGTNIVKVKGKKGDIECI